MHPESLLEGLELTTPGSPGKNPQIATVVYRNIDTDRVDVRIFTKPLTSVYMNDINQALVTDGAAGWSIACMYIIPGRNHADLFVVLTKPKGQTDTPSAT